MCVRGHRAEDTAPPTDRWKSFKKKETDPPAPLRSSRRRRAGWGRGAGKSESCVALHRETRSDAVIGRQAAHHLTALALADGVQLGESLPRELQVVVHEVVLVERRLVDHTSAQHLHSPPRQSCDGSDLVLCTVDCGLRATRVFTCFSIVRCN